MAQRTKALGSFARSLVTCSTVLLLVLCITLYVGDGPDLASRTRRTRRDNENNSTQPEEGHSLNCTRRGIESFPDGIFTDKQLHNGAVAVNLIVAVYMCGAISYICAEYFVPSLEVLYQTLNLQPDVAGATFMAAGSSAPELFTAVIGTFISKDDTGVGAILGSAAFNIFVITAICCFFTREDIINFMHSLAVVLSWWPFFRDIIVYVISIILLSLFILDSRIEWWEGLILTLGYMVYIGILYLHPELSVLAEDILLKLRSSIVKGQVHSENNTEPTNDGGSKSLKAADGSATSNQKDGYGTLENESNENKDEDNQRQRLQSWRTEPPLQSIFSPPEGLHWKLLWFMGLPLFFVFFITIPDCRKPGWQRRLYFITFLISATWLAVTTYVLYWMIVVIGYTLQVTDTVMGLTLLAAGTSLPDTVASVLVARDGFGEMAMANIFGSNIFEVFICLGLLWCLAAFINGPVVISSSSIAFTTVSLILIVVLIFFIIYLNNWTLNYKTGSFCLISYAIFLFLAIFNELGFFGKSHPPKYCTDSTL